jgi:hypothetical protein
MVRNSFYTADRSGISKGHVVDARLSHFAFGYEMAQRVKDGEFGISQS